MAVARNLCGGGKEKEHRRATISRSQFRTGDDFERYNHTTPYLKLPKCSVFWDSHFHFLFSHIQYRVAKRDIIILHIFTFKPQNHIKQCTQQLRECAQNFKSLAVLKLKIELFKVPYSPILNSLILLWFQMK